MDTVTVTINLPIDGSREDFLHCIASAHMRTIRRGDRAAAMALAGLLTMADESTAFVGKTTPHFFFPPWGSTDGNPGPGQEPPR